MDEAQQEGQTHKVPAWDLPTRLFHWALVSTLCVSWYTGEFGPIGLHLQAGYVALTLVLFRLAWGVVGSRTARFADFVAAPRAAARHLKQAMTGDHERTLGHNAAGGWSVIALLLFVAVQAGLGLFANDDIFTEGPLAHLVSKETSDWLTGLHRANVNILLALVALHVGAIVFYLFQGDNLLVPMITGYKRWQGPAPRQERAPLWRAAVALALATAVVWYLVTQV